MAQRPLRARFLSKTPCSTFAFSAVVVSCPNSSSSSVKPGTPTRYTSFEALAATASSEATWSGSKGRVRAVVEEAHRRHHRHVVALEEQLEQLGVDRHHLAPCGPLARLAGP